MPPTVQTGRRDENRDKRNRPGEKRSELVCRVKYNNTLPDIPFDPKFITYPFESNRFYTYKPTSLERSFKYDLLTEHDLGVGIDLINPDTYKIDLNAYPEPEDERLLEEDLNTPGDSKRSRHHNTNVSWLRKTEYISTEYNRFIQKADKSEAKVGFKIKQIMKEEDLYKDRESQIGAINSTFEKAKNPILKHYSKPGVKPMQVMEVFPDFQLWKHPFAQVLFDSDPAPKGYSAPVQMEEMSQAMIRGAVDESGEQFVAYFLPTDETLGKRKRDAESEKEYEEEETYEYLLAREYNWNVKNKLSKGYEETYFFVIREDGVFYNELETRVRLSKRRKTVANAQLRSRLIVKHRPLTDKELAAQEGRLQMLEPPGEEEEEEEPMPSLTAEVTSETRDESDKESGEEEEGEPKRRKIESDEDEEEEDKASVKSAGSARSRSKSRSRSRSRSASGSRSGSGSPRRSRSKSGSRSRSRSKSRSKSKSVSRSRSRSRSKSKSASRSRSRSRSKSGSRSRSRSRSASKSRSRSVSRSRSRSRSKSASDKEGSASEAEEDKGRKDEEEIFGSAGSSEDSD
ncbi:RNA polymerase II-associated factor 1 homolog [Aplysia californica]|uniref:RNA polymerase II-associated factor 1 homolog n=1 Tax=Aplysia californica TaxID=6500 RepID=A0ABM1AEG6_APLCA|nr:RNA polymerase II-associated factor 1 homolog [Aplysia californica]